jgi:hypothetical protein
MGMGVGRAEGEMRLSVLSLVSLFAGRRMKRKSQVVTSVVRVWELRLLHKIRYLPSSARDEIWGPASQSHFWTITDSVS